MDPPPPPAAVATVAAAYPESLDSSPRSRTGDSVDEPSLTAAPGGGAAKLRLMCSYGGHIVPRPHDKSLCYVGGDTRIVVADRHSSLADLTHRLSKTLLGGKSFSLKYQLPNEDLDSLISVSTDEDLENMIEEYDRLSAAAAGRKSSRLRLFLFNDLASSFGSLSSLENSAKSEDWFLNALNGATRGEFPESASVNCLLGLDDVVPIAGNSKGVANNSNGSGSNKQIGASQDVHSVPDSPILETNSSFGSTSSSPSMSNLPPIRVHVEDQKPPPLPPPQVTGIEDQFSQMGIAAPTVQKPEDGGFLVIPSPAMAVSVQSQAKPTTVADLASPDSVSSDSSLTNPLSRQRPMVYQDPVVQIQNQNPSVNSNRVPISPVDSKLSDLNPSYLYPTQFDHQLQQLNPHIHHHQQQQQPHFIQSGSQYVPHGTVPAPAYYIVYPPQQQYPSAYLSAKPAQAYNLQPNYAPSTGNQMHSSQNPQQYMGFSQIHHHQSQLIAPTSVPATGNYTYEFTDPPNSRMVYTQPLAPQMAVQYPNTAPVLSEASSQIPAEGIKQHPGLHSHDR